MRCVSVLERPGFEKPGLELVPRQGKTQEMALDAVAPRLP